MIFCWLLPTASLAPRRPIISPSQIYNFYNFIFSSLNRIYERNFNIFISQNMYLHISVVVKWNSPIFYEFIKYCWITECPNAVIRESINTFYARVQNLYQLSCRIFLWVDCKLIHWNPSIRSGVISKKRISVNVN